MYILYIKTTSNYYEKHKEKLQKERTKEKIGKKRLKKDIKILLKEKKKKSTSIIANIIKIFLRNKKRSELIIWEIIILEYKKLLFSWLIRFVYLFSLRTIEKKNTLNFLSSILEIVNFFLLYLHKKIVQFFILWISP